jgi:hypothetical protein
MFRQSAGNAAPLNTPRCRAISSAFFWLHRAPQQIGAPRVNFGETRDLHDLFPVQDHPVSGRQHRLEIRMQVSMGQSFRLCLRAMKSSTIPDCSAGANSHQR